MEGLEIVLMLFEVLMFIFFEGKRGAVNIHIATNVCMCACVHAHTHTDTHTL